MRIPRHHAVFSLAAAAIAVVALLLSACSASSTDPPAEGKSMREHEKSFDPSKYREKPAEAVRQAPVIESREAAPESEESHIWTERSEKVMGFRLQLHSTTDANEARGALTSMKQRLDSLGFEESRLDLVFDAPYYKLRYGDFLSKSDADHKCREFKEFGIAHAWVVRDNVIRIIRERKQ